MENSKQKDKGLQVKDSENQHLRKERDNLKQQIQRKEEELQAKKTEYQQLHQSQESLRQQLQRKDQDIYTKNSINERLRRELESVRRQIKGKDEEIQRKNNENQGLTRQRETAMTENQQLQQQLASTHQQLIQFKELQKQEQQLKAVFKKDVVHLQSQVASKNKENQVLQESFRQQLQTKDEEIQQLQQALMRERETVRSKNQQFQEQIANSQQQLTQAREQIDHLTHRITDHISQEIEFWQVSPEEVVIHEDQIVGRGGWGYVAKGTFRGASVAVKRMHQAILYASTLERIRREVRTMAQIRHPNLVLFIAAILSEQTGPMIVTELLDTSLRSAYEDKQIGANKRKIFEDVSLALVYLHGQREPIVHRDVSSANVLLVSQPNDKWLAKLSDFGSANLARYATTPGEGAIVYTAPEAYPLPPTSPTPQPPQTTKIDVYSFGVLMCEVVTGVFPECDKFNNLLGRVGCIWPQIHPLITSCVSHSPQDRPTMNNVLSRTRLINREP